VLARSSKKEPAGVPDAYDEDAGTDDNHAYRPYQHSAAHKVQSLKVDSEYPGKKPILGDAAKGTLGKGDTRRPSAMEDLSDEHDTDTIDSIKDSHGDQVDHDAKLLHPEDDEAGTDSEAPNFKNDGIAPLGGDAQKKMQDNVDKLLSADHPSKDGSNQPGKGDSDEDESLGEGPKVPPPIVTLDKMTPWSPDYQFPSWEECESLKERADEMPDMILVPFEEAVKDVVLEGWEDDWIAAARFTGPKLQEPKIDFVYNCKRSPNYVMYRVD
jgi:hypothetical protein